MSSETIDYVPPQTLGVAPQVRPDPRAEELMGLMQSISEVGILQPIRARRVDGKPVVISGHRRRLAAINLGLAKVPVIFELTALSEQAALQRQLIENIQRVDLGPLPKAEGIAEFMRAENCSAAQVAAKLGLSPATVARLLALLQLPEAIRERVNAGEIPASAAYELAKVSDPAKQAELAQQLAAGTLSRDGLASKRKLSTANTSPTSDKKLSRITANLGEARSVVVSAPDLTLESAIGVVEELLGKLRRGRSQGFQLPTIVKMLRDQAKTLS